MEIRFQIIHYNHKDIKNQSVINCDKNIRIVQELLVLKEKNMCLSLLIGVKFYIDQTHISK